MINEETEMPCRCNCGNWFDLHDGSKSLHSDVVICETCSIHENAEAERQGEIESLIDEIKDIECEIRHAHIQIEINKEKLKVLGYKFPKE